MTRKLTFTVLAATLALSVMPSAMANESGGGCCSAKSKTVATATKKSGKDCCSVKSKSVGATGTAKKAAFIKGNQSKTKSAKQESSMAEQMKKNPNMKM